MTINQMVDMTISIVKSDSEAKMSFSVDVLANIAIELQRGIGHQDRFQRLITTLRQVLECDASALATLRLAAVYSACHRRAGEGCTR